MHHRPAGADRLAAIGLDRTRRSRAQCVGDLREAALHVRRLALLVLRPVEVEAQHRNAHLVLHFGIDLAVAPLVGDHLAASGEADEGPVVAPGSALEACTVEGGVSGQERERAEPRHRAASAELDVVAAREVELTLSLGAVLPPRHVEVHQGHTVLVVGRGILQRRHLHHHAAAHRVHQVAAHSAAAVGEAVGKQAARRVQQDPRGLAAAGGEHDHAGSRVAVA